MLFLTPFATLSLVIGLDAFDAAAVSAAGWVSIAYPGIISMFLASLFWYRPHRTDQPILAADGARMGRAVLGRTDHNDSYCLRCDCLSEMQKLTFVGDAALVGLGSQLGFAAQSANDSR